MAVSTKIIILVFSLLALYFLARRMDLGRGECIRDDVHARQIAQEELLGFIGNQVLIDHDGHSALVRGVTNDSEVNYAYIRRHGAHFVVRLVNGTSIIQGEGNQITLRHPDLPRGAVILKTSDPLGSSQAAETFAAYFSFNEKC